ncbi:MAG: uroporphyrinogen decarboxylase family protein [Caldilineaceae bacterium]
MTRPLSMMPIPGAAEGEEAPEPTATFLRACRRLETDHTPVWFMRQAGRYMAEYRAIRAEHSMLETINTPELAADSAAPAHQRVWLYGDHLCRHPAAAHGHGAATGVRQGRRAGHPQSADEQLRHRHAGDAAR